MIDNFVIILLAILLEAFPFIVVGALISGIVEEFIPSSAITKYMPRNLLLSVAMGSLMGAALPMCECGSVLIVRRLLKKGVLSASAITYMLSGPIVNPISLTSTYVAYSWYPEMTLLRAGLGIFVAVIAGLIIYRAAKNDIIKKQEGIELQIVKQSQPSISDRFKHAMSHSMDDFIMIFSLLLIGATITAMFKAFAPSEVFLFFKEKGWLGVLLFSGLAVILSLCSEADAFISSALNGVFDISSQLAFLTIGPILDIKLIMIYKSVFTKRVFSILCIVPPSIVIVSCLILRGIL